ncbi:MAG: TetR-family transcriptional regulator [Thermoleophilia bacterium]|nr:TetR-family transcriptional regulator [Thermoleophilia bacterium]
MTSSEPPRKRMSSGERREQLLVVARSVFAEKGYDAVTVEELAQRAGVTKPIIYEHFGGKEGIYAVIIDRERSELMEAVRGALAMRGARARVEAAADAFLGYIETSPDGYRVLLRDTPQLEGALTTWGSVLGEVADQVDHLLARELDARGFDRKLAPIYSRGVIGLIGHIGQWWLETGTPSREVVAAHISNLVFNGLERLEADPTLTIGR